MDYKWFNLTLLLRKYFTARFRTSQLVAKIYIVYTYV